MIPIDKAENIKKLFFNIQSVHDFTDFLNSVSDLLFDNSNKKVGLTLNQLYYFSSPTRCEDRYFQFEIRKKSGGTRIIHAPTRQLKYILSIINVVLQCVYTANDSSYGFVCGRSIVDNAINHCNKKYVFNTDLKDFFHSFDRKDIVEALKSPPFNLAGDRSSVAYLIASLCTHPIDVNGEKKLALPQGAPTSPVLSNVLSERLDNHLVGLANLFDIRYSRYADDITFSADKFVFKKNFIYRLNKILADENNLRINHTKTRLKRKHERQEVTGLVVNSKVNVKRKYIKQLRMWLYYWEKYGIEKAQVLFINDYVKEKGHIKSYAAQLPNVVEGKLLFLKMVKGDSDSTYLSLYKRFERLTSLIQTKNKAVNENIPDSQSTQNIGSEKLNTLVNYELYIFKNQKAVLATIQNHQFGQRKFILSRTSNLALRLLECYLEKNYGFIEETNGVNKSYIFRDDYYEVLIKELDEVCFVEKSLILNNFL